MLAIGPDTTADRSRIRIPVSGPAAVGSVCSSAPDVSTAAPLASCSLLSDTAVLCPRQMSPGNNTKPIGYSGVARKRGLLTPPNQSCSSSSRSRVAATSGSVEVWASLCRMIPLGSMMNSDLLAMPTPSFRIPRACAAPPWGQKSASNGWRMPPIAVAQVLSANVESTLIPSSCAPFSSNCFNARLKVEV